MKYELLKVIVGSQAHGLDTPESDVDYRGVFAIPTSELLKIGGDVQHTAWIEGKEDNTSWEIGKFLLMATKCNPTILETFLAPQYPSFVTEGMSRSDELQSLFEYVWNANDVKNAFLGYGFNQRKKFFDKKDNRAPKYAAAYTRVLYNAWELLMTGKFTVRISDTPIGNTVRKFKDGECLPGDVIKVCSELEEKVIEAFENGPYRNKETDIQPVNDYLLRIRKELW